MAYRKGRRENENMPTIFGDGTISRILESRIELDSSEGLAWAEATTRFYFDAYPHTFTAQRQQRRNGQYWYAYRRAANGLHSAYIGKVITLDKLHAAAQKLAEKCGNRGKV